MRILGRSIGVFIGVAALLLIVSIWSGERRRRLHRAAYAGDVQALQRELDRHPERIDAAETSGRGALKEPCPRTPLMFAASYNQYDCAQVLLERGADANKRDCLGYTALHYAASASVVSVLLRHGANPNALTYHSNETPLSHAVAQGDSEMCRVLLKSGAAANNHGLLERAVRVGNYDIVATLIAHGAIVNGLGEYALQRLIDMCVYHEDPTRSQIVNILRDAAERQTK